MSLILTWLSRYAGIAFVVSTLSLALIIGCSNDNKNDISVYHHYKYHHSLTSIPETEPNSISGIVAIKNQTGRSKYGIPYAVLRALQWQPTNNSEPSQDDYNMEDTAAFNQKFGKW